MKAIKKVFKNKYLFALIAFAIWMIFFDRNNLPVQVQRYSELNGLRRSEIHLKEQIKSTREELKLLKTNPETLEKYARERYYMKRDNEDVFIVKIDSSEIK